MLVVAGSENYVGAAHLAAAGAYRVGAGLVTLACPRSLHPIIASGLTEATYLPLPEEEGGLARRAADLVLRAVEGYDVLLVGCGLGQRGATQSFVRALLFSLAGEPPPAVVVDADGLNALARTPGWWREMKAPAIVTPHPGEMSRLSGRPIAEIQADRLGCAVACAREWGKTVVLKGAHTVVAAPDGRAALSPFANPALASGGTGDVLAGALAGFLAQGLSPFEAAVCGVYVHAAAGEDARREMGDAGPVAGDLLPLLPRAIKALTIGRTLGCHLYRRAATCDIVGYRASREVRYAKRGMDQPNADVADCFPSCGLRQLDTARPTAPSGLRRRSSKGRGSPVQAEAPTLVGGRRRWRLRTGERTDALRSSDYPPLLQRLLANRGVRTLDEARRFLEGAPAPPDPFLLPDMERAVQRLRLALRRRELVAVFADFDVDGVTAAALLTQGLEALGGRVLTHIPDRFREGYGLNTDAIDRLRAQGAELLLAADCGSSSVAEVEHARALGMDVLILDHHAVPEQLPRRRRW